MCYPKHYKNDITSVKRSEKQLQMMRERVGGQTSLRDDASLFCELKEIDGSQDG